MKAFTLVARPGARSTLITIALANLIFGAVACGKFTPPLPPEMFSPREVKELQVLPQVNAVQISWKSPETDLRGEELKSIDGYVVYRKTVEKPSDTTDPEVEYEKLAEIADVHIKTREELRARARLEGKPARRVRVDQALVQFQYLDAALEPGKSYVYKIVPVNQDGVEGQVSQLIKLTFRGEASEVMLIPYTDEQAGVF